MSQYGTEPGYETEPAAGSTSDQVKDQVQQTAEQAREKTRSAAGQARGRISQQVDQRSTEAGERLSGSAADVRSIADELRRQGRDGPAAMAEQVAGQAERAGNYLKGASGDRILRDVEDVARRQPWLVAAGGLVLGFAASRFLKASSSRRYRAGDGGVGYRSLDRYDTAPTSTTGYDTETLSVPVADAPVGGSYVDPPPLQDEPLRDPLFDDRRS